MTQQKFKVKRSRRLGIPLTPKASKYMQRKPYPPGQHGKRRSRDSNYKQQLQEKQKLVAQYNIDERKMENYYDKAIRMEGYTVDRLIQQLERRLDAVVLRGGLANTIYQARQMVSHGHIKVNGKKVDIPSYQVKKGEIVTVKDGSRQVEAFHNAIQSANPPEYLSLNKPEMAVSVEYIPQRNEIPVECEIPLVIEFYSR